MLLDATVARSIAVLGWAAELAKTVGGSLYIAPGVLSTDPDERSELRGIRDALQREAQHAQPGSGRQSKAVSAVERLDMFFALGPPTVTVLMPDPEELAMAIRLSSRDAEQRNWRAQLGLTARRLDAGEAVSIAIAAARNFDFASDDQQALIAYTALGHRAGPCGHAGGRAARRRPKSRARHPCRLSRPNATSPEEEHGCCRQHSERGCDHGPLPARRASGLAGAGGGS